MQANEVISAVILLLKAFNDGKITGKELKEILNVFIDDNLEFEIKEISKLLSSLFSKF